MLSLYKILLLQLAIVSSQLPTDIRVGCLPPNNTFLFCNKSLPLDIRINNIISLLTIEEKAYLLTARKSNPILRLGIPEYNWGTNCIHSAIARCHIKHINGTNITYCPTNFPNANAIGATFNKTLVYKYAVAIALELRALWLHQPRSEYYDYYHSTGLDCWGPTINIGRDPRWGRNYEVISEDPYWNSVYGTLFTLGLQNGSIDTDYYDSRYIFVVSTLKHLAAYSLGGYQSFKFDAIVSDYLFSDTYFPPFIHAVKNGKAKGIMCSYNSINGIPACVDDKLLNKTLRQEWDFDGYIVADSGAIREARKGHHYVDTDNEAVVLALQASVDIDSGSVYKKCIPSLVNQGLLSETLVDKALYNSFKIRFDLGLFDPSNDSKFFHIPISVVNNVRHQTLNLEATHQSMTLLKNDKNILPFNASDAINKNIIYGVIGPHFNVSLNMRGGYSSGSVINQLSILNALSLYINTQNILSSQGCNNILCNTTDGFQSAFDIAEKSDIIVLMMGLDATVEKEGIDRVNISLPGYQHLLASTICKLGKPTVLVLINGGTIAIDELKDECPAILEAWNPGYRGSEGIWNTIFGINNPSGKMAMTMYYSNFTSMVDWHSMDITEKPGRTYKYWHGTPPLFPFGWGLSYTTFEFQWYDGNDSRCDEINYFCINIINSGDRSGRETIFVFIVPPTNSTNCNCSIPCDEPASKIIKKLIEFEKVYIEVGDSYVFKWEMNETQDLILYDKTGRAQMFCGTYQILFSNGVYQNMYVDYEVNNESSNCYCGLSTKDCGIHHKKSAFSIWEMFGMIVGGILICGIGAFIVMLFWYKRKNQKLATNVEQQFIQETETINQE
eukprot:742_1